ncbi:MarR family transcriptional regulator [Intrasporangium oryzae NRRL B-24470]|uniref:MarR family transcriptional regulator n=1 Tax=Intrasporangium oryzae NRRL B-24470 TaxID=1386089 RepID=W9G7C7_9MICO|nr:MarR family transcriptional regulator [Intrasporangium oryzae]EWT01187.1 MarR family transcriptional regulator [Intrasporangium oryzae NRRL B-24470]
MSPSNPTPPSSAALSLEQQICYAMHTTVRAFDAVYRELLGEHGLSYPQYIALMTVGEHGPLTVGRLGELMRLDSGTLSPLLKRMEAAGLVGRARDPEDERRVLVSVTAAGRDRLAALGDVPHQIARRSGLTRAQLVELRQTLRSVTEALQEP